MLYGLFVFFVIGITVIFLHKLGHYFVGRWLVGIPSSDIRIVVLSVPQYVAIRTGEGWASPVEFVDYLEAYAEYDPELRHVVAFLAAGELTQTLGVVTIAALALATGTEIIAQSVVLASIMLVGYHLISDLGLFFHMGHPTGDFSALWTYSPFAIVSVLLLVIVPHGLVYSLI